MFFIWSCFVELRIKFGGRVFVKYFDVFILMFNNKEKLVLKIFNLWVYLLIICIFLCYVLLILKGVGMYFNIILIFIVF